LIPEIESHVSYPYIFKYDGDIFLIPESYEEGKINLYKAKNFPDTWVKIHTLIEGVKAVDSTIFHYDNYWWVMYTDLNIGLNNNLNILYSKDLLGPWQQHEKNPVKIDISSSRPAGTPFIDKLIEIRLSFLEERGSSTQVSSYLSYQRFGQGFHVPRATGDLFFSISFNEPSTQSLFLFSHHDKKFPRLKIDGRGSMNR
jgi:hypothetical protein